MSYNEIYQQLIQEHYRASPYRGVLELYTQSSGSVNPSCGDEISLQWYEEAGIVKQIMFQGTGCVLSQIAASVLARYCHHKKIVELYDYSAEDLSALLGIAPGPNRMQCIALSVQALHLLLQR